MEKKDCVQTSINAEVEGYVNMELTAIPNLKRTRDRVRYIMEQHPATRGNDSLLVFYYLRTFEACKLKPRQFEELLMLTSFESITRTRRLIQAKGELCPSERVQRKRARREEIIRQEIGGV